MESTGRDGVREDGDDGWFVNDSKEVYKYAQENMGARSSTSTKVKQTDIDMYKLRKKRKSKR